MRGKATDREVSSNYIGITPAYAGKRIKSIWDTVQP